MKAYAVLLYNGSDKGKLRRRIEETFPDKDYIRLVYEHLAYFYQIGMGADKDADSNSISTASVLPLSIFPIKPDRH